MIKIEHELICRVKFFTTIIVGFFLTGYFFSLPAHAASLTNISDTTSRLKAQTLADHTIQFTTPSGMNGGTIVISFGTTVSDMNGIDYTDIDLLYGTIGSEIQRALYVQPGTNVWGVSADEAGKTLTLTYPNTNGQAILSNNRVIIKIGTHATYELPPTKTQFRQLKNGAVAAMGQQIRVQTQYDIGTLAIPIVSQDSIGVLCYDTLAAPGNLKAENSAGAVKLTWDDLADNETGYFVERSKEISVAQGDTVTTSYTSFDRILDLNASNTVQAVDDKIQSGTTYQYRIRAYNTCGFSSYSSTVTLKTPPGTTVFLAPVSQIQSAPAPQEPAVQVEAKPVIPSEAKPAVQTQPVKKEPITEKDIQKAPINVGALSTRATTNAITLQWQNPPSDQLGTIIIKRSSTTFPQTIASGQEVYRGIAQSFTDSALEAGTVYYYSVFSQNKLGAVSSGAFVLGATKELPIVPITVVSPVQPASEQIPQAPIPTQVPITSISSSPPVSTPTAPILLTSPSAASYSAPVSMTSGSPIPPAVVVTLPTQESSVTVRSEESQRTSAVLQDSSGGTSAFTVDIPANTFAQETRVAIAPLTTSQVQRMDGEATVPTGHQAVGNVIYKIQIKNRDGKTVKKFDKPIRLTFRYNKSLIQTINEESLKVYYWEGTLSSWVPLRSHIDTASGVIVAEVSHATLFSILGQHKQGISVEQRLKRSVAAQSSVSVKQSEGYVLIPEDLHLTVFSRLRGVQTGVRSVESTFYVSTSSIMDVCIPSQFFENNIDTVTLTLADPLRTDRYFLKIDETRNCYATSLMAPNISGSYTLTLKASSDDDRMRINTFSLMVAPALETAVTPLILTVSKEIGTPRIAGLIALLIVIVFSYVMFDIYQKVLRGRRRNRTEKS